jgi:hypothetical protein
MREKITNRNLNIRLRYTFFCLTIITYSGIAIKLFPTDDGLGHHVKKCDGKNILFP